MANRPPTLDEVELVPEADAIHTFSNGTEWDYWADANCYECRWWNPEAAGADCAFEGAALLRGVSPELAAKFGWVQRTTEYGPRSGWDAPDQCAFFRRRKDDDGNDLPDPPVIDPLQITFLAPEGWPDAPTPSPLTLRDQPAVPVPAHG